ncbi:ribosome silencing factor [Leptothrix sp. BB-4]
MDIRKLQRAIVDGLEDVKAQDIVVYNTEHLSPLFERVVIASGTSNRQTNALAASVRDAVRSAGGQILSTEGGDNGEWIIVDCGAAVVHVMQPAIRQYYHLEEIWGGKQVRIKLGAAKGGLVKASEPVEEEDETPAPAPAAKRRSPRVSRDDHLTAADNAVRASQTRVDDDEDGLTQRAMARPARKTSKTAARKPASKTAPNAGKADAPGTAVGRKAVARKTTGTTGRRAPTTVQSLVVLPEGKVVKRKAPTTAVKTATQTTARKTAAKTAAKTAVKTAAKTAPKAPAKTAAKAPAPKAPAKAPARKRSA